MIKLIKNLCTQNKIRKQLIEAQNSSVFIDTCKRQELYYGEGTAAAETVRHLYRLVSGLESPLLGETAVQGQIKKAYKSATDLSSGLHRLFQSALYVGKRVRSRTLISKGAMSYEQATINFLLQKKIDLKTAHITIIGAHNMSRNLISYLSRKDAGTIFIANRTFSKAEELAAKYGCRAIEFDQLNSALKQTDVLICATKAPHYIVKKERFPRKKMLIIDLAVPADIDPEIALIKEVELFNLSDIEHLVKQTLNSRQTALLAASNIIEEEVLKYSESGNLSTHRQKQSDTFYY